MTEQIVSQATVMDGDKSAAEYARELFHRELGLVDIVAKQVFSSTRGVVELDELLCAGREGLFEAARRFDASQRVPFRTYANYRVRGAIFDAIRKASWLPRRTQQRILALQAAGLISEGSVAHVFKDIDDLGNDRVTQESLDEHLAAVVTGAALTAEEADDRCSAVVADNDPEEAVARGELLELIRGAINELNELEASVIRHLYFEQHTLEETAKALGMQKPWACRLHTRALERLTKRLRKEQ
jgi:RNA polymerase sigma factor for flagellar operon FliA